MTFNSVHRLRYAKETASIFYQQLPCLNEIAIIANRNDNAILVC